MQGKNMKTKLTSFVSSVGDKLSKYLGKYISFEGAGEKNTAVKAAVKERLAEGSEKKKGAALEDGTENLHKLWNIAKGAAFGLIAFLFAGAEIRFGSYPLGIALLCASREYVTWAYAGIVASALIVSGNPGAVIIAATLVFTLRIILCRWLSSAEKPVPMFGEQLNFRMMTGTVGSFILGVCRIFSGGFAPADLLGSLIGLALAPLGVYIYSGFTEKTKRFTVHYEIAVSGLMFSLVWSLRAYSPAGFSLAAVAAFIITLYISKTGGVLRGGVSGLICGLAVAPMYAPLFGLAGLASGLLWGIGAVIAIAASCIVGTSYGVYLDGFSAFSSLAPDLLMGAVIFAPFVQLKLLPKILIYSRFSDLPENAANAALITEYKQRNNNDRLMALAEAMASLSEMFYTLSDRLRRPGIYDVRQLCEKTYRNYCDKCKLNSVCWDREYSSTADVINKLSASIVKNGCAVEDDIPDYMANRCPYTAKVLSDMNLEHAKLLEAAARQNKTEVFAMDYEAMAKLLRSAGTDSAVEYEPDEALSKQVRNTARYINFYAANIAVFGRRRKKIIAGGVDVSKVRLSSDEIRRAFREVCGTQLTVPQFLVDGDYITMSLCTARNISVETAKVSLAKEEEQINGDSSASFENCEDYFYTLISDGMGSGRDAAMTSRITCVFLEKMLSAGNKKSVVLEMLNNFIRNKNLECFTTVDLLEIDLLSARAGFIKSGAAPSYILRDGKLFKISSNSLPIGITREITAEEIKFDLEIGDVIVMISDGVAQSFEDGLWLAEFLTFRWDKDADLEDMAAKILDSAKKNNCRNDDMTVGIVRVCAA